MCVWEKKLPSDHARHWAESSLNLCLQIYGHPIHTSNQKHNHYHNHHQPTHTHRAASWCWARLSWINYSGGIKKAHTNTLNHSDTHTRTMCGWERESGTHEKRIRTETEHFNPNYSMLFIAAITLRRLCASSFETIVKIHQWLKDQRQSLWDQLLNRHRSPGTRVGPLIFQRPCLFIQVFFTLFLPCDVAYCRGVLMIRMWHDIILYWEKCLINDKLQILIFYVCCFV